MPKVKRIIKANGKTLHWINNYWSKADAEKRANGIKKLGYPAKVVDQGVSETFKSRHLYSVYASMAYITR